MTWRISYTREDCQRRQPRSASAVTLKITPTYVESPSKAPGQKKYCGQGAASHGPAAENGSKGEDFG